MHAAESLSIIRLGMKCRLFRNWSLLPGGCAVVFLLGGATTYGDFAKAYKDAYSSQDWTTAAEVAQRWLQEDSSQLALNGRIAEARLRSGQLEDSESWLARWESTAEILTSEMLALRGELAQARDEPSLARDLWTRSYEKQPDVDVARRLTNRNLWGADERTLYESWMKRVSADFQFVVAMRVTGEAAVRARDWEGLSKVIGILNDLSTSSAMRAAATFESLAVKELAPHDAAVRDQASGLALARRAHFFLTQQLKQLAMEDATEALARAPRMVLPKITLAQCKNRYEDDEEIRALGVVTIEERTQLPPETRLAIDRLDHAVSQPVIDPEVFLKRALALASCGQYYLALDDLTAAGPTMEQSADGLACQGECLLTQRKNDAAKQAFEQALFIDPNHSQAYSKLAVLATQRADYAEAIERYRWLVARSPDDKILAQGLRDAQSRLR